MSENTLKVDFRLMGERIDPEEISTTLGVDYTEGYLSDGKTTGFWIYSKSMRGNIELDTVCNQIVDELAPKQEVIVELMRKYDLRADLCFELCQRPRTDQERMYGRYYAKGTRFDARVLKFLCSIGAVIWFELDCECL